MNEHSPTDSQQPEEPAADPTAGPTMGESTSDERTMGMLAHLLGILTGFLGPLIIWLIKKDESPYVDYHGKESLNFQLTLMIGWVIAVFTSFIVIGCFLMPVLFVLAIVFCILASVAANRGEMYRYPISIRFIK